MQSRTFHMNDDDICAPGHEPATKGQKLAFCILGFFASFSMAAALAAVWVELTVTNGGFEGKAGFAWLFAMPVAYFAAVVLLCLIYRWAVKQAQRTLALNALLTIFAMVSIFMPLSLL